MGTASSCPAQAIPGPTAPLQANPPHTTLFKPNQPSPPSAAPVSLRGGGALNQVVAVDGGGHRRLGQARRDELQHRHLRGGILHRHAVCRAAGQGGAGITSRNTCTWRASTAEGPPATQLLTGSPPEAFSFPPQPKSLLLHLQPSLPPTAAHALLRSAALTGAEVEVGHAALRQLGLGVVQVAVHHLPS